MEIFKSASVYLSKLVYVREENNPKLKIFTSSLLQGKKSKNLKCEFKYGFSMVLCKKKNSIFDFKQKKVLYNLKFSLRVSLTQENVFSYRFHFWSQQKDIDTSKKRC